MTAPLLAPPPQRPSFARALQLLRDDIRQRQDALPRSVPTDIRALLNRFRPPNRATVGGREFRRLYPGAERKAT